VRYLTTAQQRTEDRIGRLEAAVERLAEAQRRTEEHLTSLASAVAALSVDVAVLKVHVASLRGDQFERRYRENAFAYFSRLLRGMAVVSRTDQAALADHAADRGDLTAEQATDLKYLGLVVRGQWPDGSECALAVEVSAVVDPHDVERAARRAALLGRAGLAAVPVVASERIEPAADHAARQANIWRGLDGTTLAPTDAAPVDRLAGDGRPGSDAGVAQR
jgi:hypothetical protein